MPNHFHLIISVKSQEEIELLYSNINSYEQLKDLERFEFLYRKISKAISNLCSSYTQAVNKVYNRKGSLFMPNFKSNVIEQDLSFCNAVHYVHANPVHHRFVRELEIWKFSSFHSLITDKPTLLERDYVMGIFGGKEFFLKYYKRNVPTENIWHDQEAL